MLWPVYHPYHRSNYSGLATNIYVSLAITGRSSAGYSQVAVARPLVS